MLIATFFSNRGINKKMLEHKNLSFNFIFINNNKFKYYSNINFFKNGDHFKFQSLIQCILIADISYD